jgi:3-methylcrotonyl-CoA carboxylase alpha subunit
MPPPLPSDDRLADAADALIGDQPLAGFRLNAPRLDQVRASINGKPILLPRRRPGSSHAAQGQVDTPLANAAVTGPRPSPGRVLVAEAGQTWAIEPYRASGLAAGTAADGAILSPMPGRIIAVDVAVGDPVTTGQKLVTLEAMKMEHSLTAPFDGIVAELDAETGGQVSEGKLLARVERAG